MTRRLLIAFAHPDDESFGLGGLISRYVAEGVQVYLICATNGDVGTVAPELLEKHGSIKALRLAELDCAAEKLGFTQVFKFDYKDSGMMGSATSNDPACLWQADHQHVTRRVVEVIREVQPQVIITFNRYGGYGHPDHIAIQRATTSAFQLAGQTDYDTGQPPYQPQKLYYSSIARLFLRYILLVTRLRGQDPRRLGKNADVDLVAVLENAEPVHTRVDIRRYYAAWDEASACHVSQAGSISARIPRWVRQWLIPFQYFTRVHPAPAADRIDEHDLFVGVAADEPVRETPA